MLADQQATATRLAHLGHSTVVQNSFAIGSSRRRALRPCTHHDIGKSTILSER